MKKVLTPVAVVLVLGAFHSWGCRPAGGDGGTPTASTCTTPCDHVIVLRTDQTLSCPDVTITLGQNEVVWRTDSATAKLQITFDAPSPFPNLRCENTVCVSGKSDLNALPPGSNSKTFNYNVLAPEPESAQKSSQGGGTGGSAVTPTPTVRPMLVGHIIIQR